MLAPGGIGALAAVGAGLASFCSPCVLPLVPGYLAYLAGTAGADGAVLRARRWRVAGHALAFVVGFGAIFVVLGAGATAVGQALLHHGTALRRLSGGALILLGLALALAYVAPRLPGVGWVYRARRVDVRLERVSPLRSVVVGAAFGAGWTPCIGPLLGAILTLAADEATVGRGIALLALYALGLGAPFLVMGVLIDQAGSVARRLGRYAGPLSVANGVVLAAMGVLMATGALESLARFAPLLGTA
jgi:cytochrome c-type biogenesis protein